MIIYEVDRDEGFISNPDRDISQDEELIRLLNLLVGKNTCRWGSHYMAK